MISGGHEYEVRWKRLQIHKELFKNRRTVAIPETRSTARRATTGNGKLTYHKIRSGETLGGIAGRYGVTVKQLQSWNGLRNTNISAGKQLKIYK